MLQRSLCEGKLFNSVCKTELIRVIKFGLFLKQGGKVNYFCLKNSAGFEGLRRTSVPILSLIVPPL